MSGTDRGHLRGISETSVSTQGGGVGARSSVGGSNYATPMAESIQLRDLPTQRGITPEASSAGGRPGVVSPLTPPDTVNTTGDYLGARSVGKRRSNFEERLEEDK